MADHPSPDEIESLIRQLIARESAGIGQRIKAAEENIGVVQARQLADDLTKVSWIPSLIELVSSLEQEYGAFNLAAPFDFNLARFLRVRAANVSSGSVARELPQWADRYGGIWAEYSIWRPLLGEFADAAINLALEIHENCAPLTTYINAHPPSGPQIESALAFAKHMRAIAMARSTRAQRIKPETDQKPPPTGTVDTPPSTRRDQARYTAHQREILQALLELKAFDEETRKNITEIGRKALGPDGNSGNLARDLSKLAKRGLVETKEGWGGGAWLTVGGIEEARKLNQA
jgi:hypothetical protein